MSNAGSITGTQEPDSTTPDPEPPDRLRKARATRRALAGVLAAFVILGMFGLFGSKTDGVTATGGGYTLSVIYPRVTRPGLPVRWIYTVRHPGGFRDAIRIATSFEYLNLFDLTNIQPDASSQTASGSTIVWSFEPPAGDEFSVTYDAATEVGLHELPPATASVVVDGRPVVQVRFKTVVVP
jgi:hypothetical protein